MTRNTKLTAFGLLATLAAASVAPAFADKQSDKNTMRNLTIGGAAVAAYGLFSHNNTLALLGAGGAALAGSQYEKDRHQQSQDSANRTQWYYRRGGSGYNHSNGNRHDNTSSRYEDRRQWNDGNSSNRDNNDPRQWRDNDQNRHSGDQNQHRGDRD